MAQGHTLTAFAGSIDVCVDTVTDWQAAHPEFLRAVKIARAKRLIILERGLFNESEGPRVTARIFALKATCRDEWSEVNRTELTGKNGAPLHRSAKDLSDDELMAVLEKRGVFHAERRN